MIFHRITLTNLFSYHGIQTYEFLPGADRPVVLVMGRNGYGKTSLLNAVKLLFLGTESKDQRKVGFPPRNLGRNEYVLGTPRGWAGIRNRHATEDISSVRIDLGDSSGNTFTVTRSWRFWGNDFQEDFRFQEKGQVEVAGDAAEERLSNLLPRELVPFFFFDGEEVQFLAEGGDKVRAEAMERLLSLSFITGVEAQLTEVIKTWSRESLPQDVQVEIKAEEGHLKTLQAQIVADRHHAEATRRAIAERRDEEQTLRRRMDGMRAGGAVADTRRLEADISTLEAALESEQADLALAVATDAPLLANPGLVKAALPLLAEAVDHKTETANSVADTLAKVLPQRLFVEPPQPRVPLSDEQRRFYESKLHHILDSYAVTDEAPPPVLGSLDLGRARDLHQKFNRFNAAMSTLRQDRARRLREVSSKRAQLERMRAERRELEFGAGDRAEEYRRLEEAFAEISRDIGRLEAKLAQQEGTLAEQASQEKEIAARLTGLERRQTQATSNSERLRIATDLRDTFHLYRQRNRTARRQQIEDTVNRHFQRLMSGHRMIDHIRIDDDFAMHFLDAQGDEFGQATVSHGMRQLAVTALLWALKDVSGRGLPIIVDTPLARIDRDNQHNLLRAYYPHAAEQVIILATDSEIDAEKFALLRDHVGVQFHLENADGQSTRIIRSGTDRPASEAVNG